MLISIYSNELLAAPAYGFAHKFMFNENAVLHALIQSGEIGKGLNIFKMLLGNGGISYSPDLLLKILICCRRSIAFNNLMGFDCFKGVVLNIYFVHGQINLGNLLITFDSGGFLHFSKSIPAS